VSSGFADHALVELAGTQTPQCPVCTPRNCVAPSIRARCFAQVTGSAARNVFGWYPAREDINNNPIAPAPSDMHG